jgi:hypothetical protein
MNRKRIIAELNGTINKLKTDGASDEQINDVWVSICIKRTGLYHEG